MIAPVKKRITTNTTTTVATETRFVAQIVISVAAAGTSWKLRIQDKSTPSPFVLVAETTLSAPSTPTAAIIRFEIPIRMDGGIDIVTPSGTPGEVAVWISFGEQT